MQPVEQVKKATTFWTANSKKVTLAVLFLASVIVDKVVLNDIIYGTEDLYQTKVFKAIAGATIVILTHDIQGIINTFVKGKINSNLQSGSIE